MIREGVARACDPYRDGWRNPRGTDLKTRPDLCRGLMSGSTDVASAATARPTGASAGDGGAGGLPLALGRSLQAFSMRANRRKLAGTSRSPGILVSAPGFRHSLLLGADRAGRSHGLWVGISSFAYRLASSRCFLLAPVPRPTNSKPFTSVTQVRELILPEQAVDGVRWQDAPDDLMHRADPASTSASRRRCDLSGMTQRTRRCGQLQSVDRSSSISARQDPPVARSALELRLYNRLPAVRL